MDPIRFKARTRFSKPERGKMNRTESELAEYLEAQRLKGEIVFWEFEPLKIRLADNTFYEPDFLIVRADQTVEFCECKACWIKDGKPVPHYEDDARVKLKVAAFHKLWMWHFTAMSKIPRK
ncbi:MAG: hypothetical protein IT428_25250, partial [Planctomycetaceae bacterium]|nr:hypothetical protein [Planctomycetaceae bacterium]